MQESNNLPEMHWQPEPPASLKSLRKLSSVSGLNLPEEYLSFLRFSNGGEGDLSVAPEWFSLWTAEEVVQLNGDYEVQKWLPGFFGFGSNGGGELLAFDTRMPHPWRIYTIPFVGMAEEEALLVAQSFSDFVAAAPIVLPVANAFIPED